MIKSFLSLILFSIIISTPLFANEKVIISSYDDDGFYILDEDKNVIGGYAYDLQSALNRYLKWDVGYSLGDWKECQENVLEGKTDLLFGVFKTDEREKCYSFNTEPIAIVTNNVCARVDAEALNGNYTKRTGKTVGLIDGSVSSQKFKDFLNKNKIDVNYVIGASSKDLRDRLKNHKIDYLVLNTNIID